MSAMCFLSMCIFVGWLEDKRMPGIYRTPDESLRAHMQYMFEAETVSLTEQWYLAWTLVGHRHTGSVVYLLHVCVCEKNGR